MLSECRNSQLVRSDVSVYVRTTVDVGGKRGAEHKARGVPISNSAQRRKATQWAHRSVSEPSFVLEIHLGRFTSVSELGVSILDGYGVLGRRTAPSAGAERADTQERRPDGLTSGRTDGQTDKGEAPTGRRFTRLKHTGLLEVGSHRD